MAGQRRSLEFSDDFELEPLEGGFLLAPPPKNPKHPEQSEALIFNGNNLSLEDVEMVEIQIRDLSVSVDKSSLGFLKKHKPNAGPDVKSLIRSISASFQPGTLTAIMGGSGSGKTTLLNTVSERVASARLTKSGSITFNGAPGIGSVRHAYVIQQDILLPTLTVRETLQYSAELRLPPSTSSEERRQVVEEVILELGLKDCADTRVGDGAEHKGCSGGERRRVSLGVQLLANPSVLFLDEPTTGLDATSAFLLMRTLKNLAAKGRTILTTIHQPRSEIWDLFDNLAILTRGSPVFVGPREDCIPWFAALGFTMPAFVNPADFVIDTSAMDNRSRIAEEESTARVSKLKKAWEERSSQLFPMAATKATGNIQTKSRAPAKSPERHATKLQQVRTLTSRTFKVTYRDPMGMFAYITEAILLGIITGYAFHPLGRDQTGIRNREGALYVASAMQAFIILIFETYRMTTDIPTFDRERIDGVARPLPFILSRRLARLVTEDIAVPLIHGTLFYFIAGFDNDAGKFFVFIALCIINHYIAVTCAMVSVAVTRNFASAALIGELTFTLQTVAGGFFIQSNTIPVYVRWTKYLTFSWYIIGALCGNEFKDAFFDCPFGDDPNDPACMPYTGAFIMDSLGFPGDWTWRPALASVGFVLFFLLATWLLLELVEPDVTIAKQRAATTDLSAGKELVRARTREQARPVDVDLDMFALNLDRRSVLGRRLPPKTILNPVTTTFSSGVLNVVMGPSGSGKTSLLNAAAMRLKNSPGTTYRSSGRLLFNGAEPSASVVRSVVSYVTQDDNALLPSLTVRETLYFAARLRLPSSMSKEDKARRADEVLLKMGLRDCADTLVGNDWVKGISGGEKRRVSIAVQILTEPKILFLDEPTSGLDSFTASSLLQVLHGLAMEGRTLILTIHQARSDLFSSFGNVLLLARGGHVVYTGPAREMLPYFSEAGHDCPENANPSDFVLDLATVDLQSPAREAATRSLVQSLVDRWASRTASVISTASLPASTQLFRPAELGSFVRPRSGFRHTFPILLRRAALNLRRQPPLIISRLGQIVGLGVVNILFFAPLRTEFVYIQTYLGFIQQFAVLYFVGMLQNVAMYPAERDVFYREQDDGIVEPEAFLAVYTLIELSFELISALLIGLMFDLAVGMPRTPTMFFVVVYLGFGLLNCGESIGVLFNTVFNHAGFALNATSWALSIANMMAGVIAIQMPAVYRALNWLSPSRHGVHAATQFAMRDLTFSCDDSQKLPNGDCFVSTGKQVLDLYNLNEDGPTNLWAMAITVVGYRLLAWALLRIVRTRWKS